MISDKFILGYISNLKRAIEDAKNDHAKAVYTDLYTVGKVQGLIDGFVQSLQILEASIEDADQ